jgi:hypothetical protein
MTTTMFAMPHHITRECVLSVVPRKSSSRRCAGTPIGSQGPAYESAQPSSRTRRYSCSARTCLTLSFSLRISTSMAAERGHAGMTE